MMTLTERINELNTLLEKDEFSVALQESFTDVISIVIAAVLLFVMFIQFSRFKSNSLLLIFVHHRLYI